MLNLITVTSLIGALALTNAAPTSISTSSPGALAYKGYAASADCDGWTFAVGALPSGDNFIRVSVSLYRVNPDGTLTLVDSAAEGVGETTTSLIDTGDVWNHELGAGTFRAYFDYEVFYGTLTDPGATATPDRSQSGISAADFVCTVTVAARTPGYWKNHPEAWGATSLTIGGVTLTQAELMTIFDTPVRGDMTIILAKHLIAAKLNLIAGAAAGSINTTIADADTFLGANPVGSKPKGADKQAGEALKDTLDAYNNGQN